MLRLLTVMGMLLAVGLVAVRVPDDRGDQLSLSQNDIFLKHEAYQHLSVESQGAVVPVIFILAAVIVLVGLSFFLMPILRDDPSSKDTMLSSSPQQPTQAAPLGRAGLQASPPAASLLQRSPAAQATLPRTSPVPAAVQPHAAAKPPAAAAAASSMTSAFVHAPVAGSDIEQAVEPPRQQLPQIRKTAITSTALIVRSPEGVVIGSDHKCEPHPEQRVVTFSSLKGANAVVRARIDELGAKKQVTVESASGIPLAVVDTTCACYPREYDEPPEDSRYAQIYRVVGGSFSLIGSPCASVRCAGYRRFTVIGTDRDVLLTVQCDEQGYILEMKDANGGIVVRQEAARNRTGGAHSSLWVSQGTDMTLLVCVVLAVWKLA